MDAERTASAEKPHGRSTARSHAGCRFRKSASFLSADFFGGIRRVNTEDSREAEAENRPPHLDLRKSEQGFSYSAFSTRTSAVRTVPSCVCRIGFPWERRGAELCVPFSSYSRHKERTDMFEKRSETRAQDRGGMSSILQNLRPRLLPRAVGEKRSFDTEPRAVPCSTTCLGKSLQQASSF